MVFQLAQLRRSPLSCESLWGWQAEDVSLVAWPLVCPYIGPNSGSETSWHGSFEENARWNGRVCRKRLMILSPLHFGFAP